VIGRWANLIKIAALRPILLEAGLLETIKLGKPAGGAI